MNLRILFLLPLLCVGMNAVPPRTIEGMLYSERITAGAFNDSYYTLIEFRKDNIYAVMAVSASSRPTLQPSALREGISGTYEYVMTGPSTARLTLNSPNGLGPRPVAPVNGPTIDLQFRDDQSGVLILPQGFGGTFGFSVGGVDAPLINESARGFVDSTHPLRCGFVLRHTSYVLVRAIGPALQQFGIESPARDPKLLIEGRITGSNDNWGDALVDAALFGRYVGAFPLPEGSKDAVLAIRLNPGAYVVTASVDSGDSGEVLVEVYLFLSDSTP